jgi:hypothetical protein
MALDPDVTSMMPGGWSGVVAAESGSSIVTCHVSADLVNGSTGTFRM